MVRDMYAHLLIAIDLTVDASSRVLERAASFAGDGQRIDVLHVVEPQYIQYSLDPTMTGSMTRELEAAALTIAGERLQTLCQPYGIPQSSQHLRIGRAAAEIHDTARELQAYLIVVGSHGYHGWRSILGSTANAVLHGTPVDTLVVVLAQT